MISRQELRWNGWGRLGESFRFSPEREAALLRALGRRLGCEPQRAAEPVELEALEIPLPGLDEAVLAKLRAACGDDGVRTSRLERVSHATGRSLPDLLRLRAGRLDALPEAVVHPPDEGAVAAVLRVAADAGLAVVPFGGGTSVVGGVAPLRGEGQRGVLCLDTTRLDALVRVDPEAGTATLQAGIDGPALEAALARHGLTLGHFPQSFEHSTLGGWIATRSSGQRSSRYGGIADRLVSLRVVTPEGVLRTLEVPRSAAGPDLNALVLGSEGTLGVIVEATLRVSPRPTRLDDRGMLFRSFGEGVTAIREVVQAGERVAMLRLSDASETELFELLRQDPSRRLDPAALFLRAAGALGYGPGRCAMLYGGEGVSPAALRRELGRVRSRLRRHGGLPLGTGPGRSWRRDRFRTPYLRDWLLDWGLAVDTFETALPWSRLERGHQAVLRATRASLAHHAGGGVAMAHVSHSYPDGASLYFTILYPLADSDPIAQWSAIKRDATDAVVAAGGTLSHHHGIGTDHAAWLPAEKGAVALSALAAARAAADPQRVMNPGKLL